MGEGGEKGHAVEKLQPLGARSEGLFFIEEDNPPALVTRLRKLRAWIEEQPKDRQIEALARGWYATRRTAGAKLLAVSFIVRDRCELLEYVALAERSLV
jgi:acyl transferase domain-containing protein